MLQIEQPIYGSMSTSGGGGSKYAPRYIKFRDYYGNELDEEIANLDTSNILRFANMFRDCSYITHVDLSNFNFNKGSDYAYMFYRCGALVEVDVSKIIIHTNIEERYGAFTNMFTSCSKLNDESLNSILMMCSKNPNYYGTKTLSDMGVPSDLRTKCTTLSNYQAFLDAGWTL